MLNQTNEISSLVFYTAGTLYSIVMILSVFANLTILVLLLKSNNFKNPIHYFTISLTFVNLLIIITQLPASIISSFTGYFIFGEFGCKITAFLMYFLGVLSIYLLMIKSIERYWLISFKPFEIKCLELKLYLIITTLAGLFCLFWTFLPFLGWSDFSYGHVKTACSLDWKNRSQKSLIYVLIIIILFFFVPFILIIFFNIKLLIIIQKNRKKLEIVDKISSNMLMAKFLSQKEVKQIKIVVSISLIYMICWTPYTFLAIYTSFTQKDASPMTETLSTVFAKSSVLWSALFELYFNNTIRKIISNFKKRNQQETDPETGIKLHQTISYID